VTWERVKDDVEEYVKTCLACQQNQTFNKKQARLLRPLPIPNGPWENVSMDFMVSLPPLRGFDAIMVVVDRFSKMAHFIPAKDNATTQEMGRLFFIHVFKHHGLPKDIVEAHGVGAQDEHRILTPNRWTNQEGELGYPTIPKELCGGGPT
jgi:hypothetical protein